MSVRINLPSNEDDRGAAILHISIGEEIPDKGKRVQSIPLVGDSIELLVNANDTLENVDFCCTLWDLRWKVHVYSMCVPIELVDEVQRYLVIRKVRVPNWWRSRITRLALSELSHGDANCGLFMEWFNEVKYGQ